MAGADFGTNLAAGMVKDLVWGAAQQARYCYQFNTLVTDLANEEDKLISTRNSMLDQVRKAKANTQKPSGDLQQLLEEAKDLIKKAEKLKEKAEASKNNCVRVCPNWINQYVVGKHSARMKEAMEQLNEKLGSKLLFANRLSLRHMAMTSTSESFIFFACTNKAHNELLMALKNDEIIRIGLYGMGGCGKTSLLKEVRKAVEDLKLFDKVVYVIVSNPPNIQAIQDSIASWLGLKFETEKTEPERAARLSMGFDNSKNYLIILDDVWQVLKFEDIGIPIGENCKVLLSTRQQHLCTLMDCQEVIHLSLLTKGEAWILFQKHAGVIEDTFEDLAQEITDECERLPVAIKAVASTLKGKPPIVWKEALKTLRDCKPLDIEKGLENPYKCLRLSFDHLEGVEERSLFLLCALFPEDSEIALEILIRFAFGLGIFEEVESYERARSKVGAAINKIIDYCLLLQAGGGHVKMHDLVRDVALWIANKETQVILGPRQNLKALTEKAYMKDTTRLHCHDINDFPNQLNCPKLEILIVSSDGENSSPDFPYAFFKEMTELKVLAIIDTYVWTKPNLLLPQSIEELKNLRTLCLRGLTLDNTSILGKLGKLDTIELLYCAMKGLPKELAELRRLKLLEVSGCQIGGNPYEVLARCSQRGLEEMYFVGNNHPRMESNGQNVVELFHQVASSTVLQRYHIEIGSSIDMVKDDLTSKFISINNFNASNSSEAIKGLAQKLEILFLEKIQGDCKNIIPDMVPIDGGCMTLNELTEFLLRDSDYIECIIDTTNQLCRVRTVFSKLLKLRIEAMKCLETLCRGPPPSSLFEKLEELFIMECSKLHCIVSVGKLNLCSLKFLELEDCPKLTSLFMPTTAQTMVMLEVLKVRDCAALKHIIIDEEEDDIISIAPVFPKLKQVIVKGCEHLECIIPASFAGGLSQLESLEIEDAHELKNVFGKYNSEDQNQNEFQSINLPILKVFKLIDLPNIISICPQNYHIMWPSLQKPYIRGCRQLTSIFDIDSEVRQQGGDKSTKQCSSNDFLLLNSTKLAYDQLLESLVGDDEASIIGLYGIEGCGKTTLAKEVSKAAEQYFDVVIFVVVSSLADVQKIQGTIASSIGWPLMQNESQRANFLFSKLSNRERILIILDDVRQQASYEEIGIPCGPNHMNCNILLTTRMLQVCTLNNCQKVIPLHLLREEEAWIMFQEYAGTIDKISDTSKFILAQEILRECRGLAIAIKIVAMNLKGKTLAKWRELLETLRDSRPLDIEEGTSVIYSAVKFIYDNLENEATKSLFLLCSAFPEDFEIQEEYLTRYGGGLGLFGELVLYERTRNQVNVAKNMLIDCCLLLKVRNEQSVKMHTVVRGAALWIAKAGNKVIAGPEMSRQELKKYATMKRKTMTYLWLNKVDSFLSELDFSKLEILFISLKEVHVEKSFLTDQFFEGMKELRVLVLENDTNHFIGRPSSIINMSLQSLTNLRCLHLTGWKFSDISFLERLTRLETLRLWYCSFYELPNGIIKLTKLRLLDLLECEIERNPYKVIVRCSQLQELYLYGNHGLGWKDYEKKFVKSFGKSRTTQALQRYHIGMGSTSQAFRKKDFSTSRSLSVQYFDAFTACETTKNLMQRAEVLFFHGIHGGCKNVIPEMVQKIGGCMSETAEMELSHCEGIECLIDTTQNLFKVESVFSKLVNLHLKNMSHLETLFIGPSPSAQNMQNLRNLKFLELEACTVLTVFPPTIAQSLELLEELQIKGCNRLKHVLTGEERLSAKTDKLVFPKLKRLYVFQCRQLEYITPASYAGDLVQLEELVLETAPRLHHVFGHPELEDLDQNELHTISFPAMRELRLIFLPRVTSICPKHCYPTWPSLQHIKLLECQRLCISSINNPIVGRTISEELGLAKISSEVVVQNVKNIHIFECGIEGIFQLAGLAKSNSLVSHLQSLVLVSLPYLTYICEGQTQFDSLGRVKISNCGNLKCIFSLWMARNLSPLRELVIEYCTSLEKIVENEDHGSPKSTSISTIAPKQHPRARQNTGPVNLSNLKRLTVKSCLSLRSLFSILTAKTLKSLKTLKIEECTRMEVLIKDESVDAYKGKETVQDDRQAILPKLINLSLENLPKLIHVCQRFKLQTVHGVMFPESFNLSNLQRLTVKSCPRLRSLFTVLTAKTLTSLNSLEIVDCFELEYVTKDEEVEGSISEEIVQDDGKVILPKLKILRLVNLPSLIHVHRGFKLELYEQCEVHDCPYLEQTLAAISEDLPQKYKRPALEGKGGEKSGPKEKAEEVPDAAVAEEHDHDDDDDDDDKDGTEEYKEVEYVVQEDGIIIEQSMASCTDHGEAHKAVARNPSLGNYSLPFTTASGTEKVDAIHQDEEVPSHTALSYTKESTDFAILTSTVQDDNLNEENEMSSDNFNLQIGHFGDAEVDQQRQEFDSSVENQEGLQENFYPVCSKNLRKSDTKRAKASVYEDVALEESKVATSSLEDGREKQHKEEEYVIPKDSNLIEQSTTSCMENTEAHKELVGNPSITDSSTGKVDAIQQDDNLNEENQRSNNDIPSGLNLNEAAGSNFHLQKQDDLYHEVQATTEVPLQSEEFDVIVDTQEGFQEQKFYPIGSMNLRESNTKIAKGSVHEDLALEESNVASNFSLHIQELLEKLPQVELELPQALKDPHQALQESKVLGEDLHYEIQTAAKIDQQIQEFDSSVENQEGLQEQNFYPVGSKNLRESDTEVKMGSGHKDLSPEESEVATSLPLESANEYKNGREEQELKEQEYVISEESNVIEESTTSYVESIEAHKQDGDDFSLGIAHSDLHYEIQAAAPVHLQSQEFDIIVDTQEGLQEQSFYPVSSTSLRESNTEISNECVHKDPAPEKSEVATSSLELVEKLSQVEVEHPQAMKDPQQALQEYKVSLPLPVHPTMLTPSTIITTTLTSTEALTSSSSSPRHACLLNEARACLIDKARACLLGEAISKYPHLWEWKMSQKSPRFCKLGYESLADMLEFLKSETPKAMNSSKRKKFEDLCAELESFGFDKEWLASIRQRVMKIQIDHNDKLNQLESTVSTLQDELNIATARIASIKDDLSKLDDVFGF